jgi:hypothetical protein
LQQHLYVNAETQSWFDLYSLGEATTGMAMVAWQEHPSQHPGTRCIPTKIETVFKKKARGLITATVDLDGAQGGSGAMLAAGQTSGVKDVLAVLKDKSGDIVAEVLVTWSIKISERTVEGGSEPKKLQ